MSSGGRDGYDSDEKLDLDEIKADLSASADSAGSLNFKGFDPKLPSFPVAQSLFGATAGIKPKSAPTSPKLSRTPPRVKPDSAPSTPSSVQTALSVQQRIASFESLTSLNQQLSCLSLREPQTSSRTPALPAARSNSVRATGVTPRRTRLSVKRGLRSPLEAEAPSRKKRRRRGRSYNLKAATNSVTLVSMAQSNIPSAGRLNPRSRKNGGVGDTLATLHFPELPSEGIPTAGKNILHRFIPLRTRLVADTNLLFTDATNVTASKELIEGYLEEVIDNQDRFNKVLETMEEEVANAENAITDMVTLEGELRGLLAFCKIKLVNQQNNQGAGAADTKLERLNFPRFGGDTNYCTFKASFQNMALPVQDDDKKKYYLLQCLYDRAKVYIDKHATHRTTYNEIFAMLDERYDDPVATNYSMLHRVFNSSHLNTPQSTQSHWDDAVGDIQEVIESGLTVPEILVYARLHKFQPEMVRRVKDMHRVLYRDRNTINLEEAKLIFNKLTAEDESLTEDSVAIEKGIRNLTLVAVPQFPSGVTTQAQPHFSQAPPTSPITAGYNNTPQYYPQNRDGFGRGRGRGGGRGNAFGTRQMSGDTGQSQGRTQQPQKKSCFMCDCDSHLTFECTFFTSALEKRAELLRIDKCQNCGYLSRPSHTCPNTLKCKHCGEKHRNYLCTNTKSSGGQVANGTP